MTSLGLFLLLTCLFATGQGEIFTRCGLAKRLQELGLDGYKGYSLGNWVCMAYHESRFNTAATHYNDYDGSTDFGIFQINSRYWCQYGSQTSSNICGIQCSELLTDDIAVDVRCAKTVVTDSANGMGAWVAWRLYCEGRDVSQYIQGCNV
uniref:Glycosyl hydrolases family 22 (GH22) domain-containing protein n=1 Tax=Salvator merianae TaxID=96440 RepID=A0A8D0E235_SALMN